MTAPAASMRVTENSAVSPNRARMLQASGASATVVLSRRPLALKSFTARPSSVVWAGGNAGWQGAGMSG
jgi:hypothetical protein